jgi:saccharopine dehydrogenase (NAD+, L-lysine-forming)
VIGAAGRSGTGARAALDRAAIVTTAWDIRETEVLDKTALGAHDILVNTVLTTQAAEPFLTPGDLARPGRRLRVLCDVTCDVASPLNRFPVYDTLTSWEAPVRPVAGAGPALDVIAIDNLPSLLPREASETFSAALAPHIPSLAATGGVWQASRDAFAEARARLYQEGVVAASQ